LSYFVLTKIYQKSKALREKLYFMREYNLQDLSVELIQMRLKYGLSQEEFAKKIGLKSEQYCRYESGKQNMTILTLVEIAEICGYEVEIKLKKKRKSIT